MQMQYYIDVLKKYAVFTGRASRAEYWYFVLFNVIISIVLGIIDGMLSGGQGSNTLGSLYSLAVFIPGIAVGVRRMHDINKSGWMLLVSLIPIVGWIWAIVLLATKGDTSKNQYGEVPTK